MEKGWNDLQRLKLPRRGSNRRSSIEHGEPAPGIPAPGTVTAVTPLPLSGRFKLGSGAEREAGVRPLPVPANPLACIPPIFPPSPRFST